METYRPNRELTERLVTGGGGSPSTQVSKQHKLGWYPGDHLRWPALARTDVWFSCNNNNHHHRRLLRQMAATIKHHVPQICLLSPGNYLINTILSAIVFVRGVREGRLLKVAEGKQRFTFQRNVTQVFGSRGPPVPAPWRVTLCCRWCMYMERFTFGHYLLTVSADM